MTDMKNAYQLTNQPDLLVTAQRFADCLIRTPPGSASEHPTAWYRDYSTGPGRQGTYAEPERQICKHP